MGGLLAATMLARRARRVVVLEREPTPGGRLRSFEVGEFVVDAGAYLWPNAWIDEAFERADVRGFRGSPVPANEVMRLFVEGHGGTPFAFPWPARPPSSRVLEATRAALGVDPASYEELTRLWTALAAANDEQIAAWKHVPARDALGRLGVSTVVRDAFLRNVMCFGTASPGAASMAECAGLLRRDLAGRAARPECAGPNPDGGVRAMVRAMVAAAKRAGVEIRCEETALRVVTDAGRTRGVVARRRSEGPREVRASVVVCNLPAARIFDVVPEHWFAPDFVRDTRSWTAIGGVVASAFAFDGLPILRATGEPDRFRGWTRLLTGPESGFGGGCLWSSHHSPHNAPAGKHVLQAMRLTSHEEIDRPERVEEIQAGFERMVAEIYRDADDKLLWKRSWVTRDGT